MFIGKILISCIIRMWLLGYVYTNILMFGCNNEKLSIKIENWNITSLSFYVVISI